MYFDGFIGYVREVDVDMMIDNQFGDIGLSKYHRTMSICWQ